MTVQSLSFQLLLAGLPLTIACSSGDEMVTMGPDAGALQVDAASALDSAENCPTPTSVLPLAWRPINSVSVGTLSNINASAMYIDGSAGGIQNSPDNPYLYIRFGTSGPEKVEVTDTEAPSQTTWDLAVKRMVWKSNGGDSGIGGVRISSVSATNLTEVTALPSSADFLVDDWITESCEYNGGLIEEPNTAVGTWYNYETGQLSPSNTVYIVERPDNTRFKFMLADYYYNGLGSAHYEFHWAPL